MVRLCHGKRVSMSPALCTTSWCGHLPGPISSRTSGTRPASWRTFRDVDAFDALLLTGGGECYMVRLCHGKRVSMSPALCTNIMVRGINKTDIFKDKRDKAPASWSGWAKTLRKGMLHLCLGPHGQPRSFALQERPGWHLSRHAQAPHLVCPVFQPPPQPHRSSV